MSKGGGSKAPTEAEWAAYEDAKQKWELSKELQVVKDSYKQDVEKMGTSEAQNKVTGLANIAAQNQSNDLINAGLSSVTSRGVNPSSGAYLSASQGLSDAGADMVGNAQQKAAYDAESAHLQGQQNVINMALGESVQASQGLNAIADNAVAKANAQAKNRFNEHAANTAAIGNAAGLAIGAFNNRSKPQSTVKTTN